MADTLRVRVRGLDCPVVRVQHANPQHTGVSVGSTRDGDLVLALHHADGTRLAAVLSSADCDKLADALAALKLDAPRAENDR